MRRVSGPGTLACALLLLAAAPAGAEPLLELAREGNALTGRLSDGGQPLFGAAVELAALDLGARSGPQPRRISGLVPPDAATAVVALRADTEGACVCAGPAGVVVGGVRYSEPVGGQRQELSPLKLPIDDAPASYRTLELLPEHPLSAELGRFSVNPGAAYLLQAPLAATANAAHAGYLALIFLDEGGNEIRRDKLWFEPATRVLGKPVTGEDGGFRLELPPEIAAWDPQLRATFAGAAATLPPLAPSTPLPALARRYPEAAQRNGRKLVWFVPREDFLGRLAQGESWDALLPQWREGAAHVHIIKLNPLTLSAIPDAALPRILRELESHGLALGLEIQPLNKLGELACGEGVEGYSDPAGADQVIEKILRAGGNLAAVAFDEPLWYGHYWTGKDACNSSIYDVARRAAAIVKIYAAAFPNLVAGDTEPFPELSDQPRWEADYATWAKAFRDMSGVPLSFLHLDFNWSNPHLSGGLLLLRGQNQAEAIAELARRIAPPLREQVPELGLICNGDNGATSDAKWTEQARAHIDAVEASGIKPEQVLFETWARSPSHTLPESDPSTLAGLLADYFKRYPEP